ncbi:MAG: hypothetical protein RLO81_07385 [Fulvivirga sp.]|uniref:hypothetical protein n=1 Tax=Fulvivirga sp. TaxID=1931237 RepID=UPI0032EBE73A
MKKALFFILLIPICFTVSGQANFNYHNAFEQKVLTDFITAKKNMDLELQLIADPSMDLTRYERIKSDYVELLSSLQSKQESSKNDGSFMSWMFYKVHRKILKNYTQYTSLASTIESGNYDCLSATSLYALLLNDLGYSPRLVETTYHIYLLVETENQRFLFESTDPINGFVESNQDIEQRLVDYSNENESPLASKVVNYYKFSSAVNEQIGMVKLVGLQYYNEAVEHYNSQKLISTIDLLEKASFFYHSDRITEFGLILARAIVNDTSLNDNEKLHSINRVSNFLKSDRSLAVR